MAEAGDVDVAPQGLPSCDGAACDGPSCDGAACDGVCDGACDSGCDSCGCGRSILPCATGDPINLWDRIMGPCHDSKLDVGGWFQVGYHTYNTGMFNNYPDTVQLHQAYGYIGKEADGSCGWDWGFRFDYVYGTDGPDTQAFGNPPGSWDEGWDAGGFYGHAIPQLYAEVAYGDLSIKAGHFYTICGYEVVPATGNFFYSHAFTMYNAEPFTHSGALATYKMLDDNVTLYGGWSKGWDTGFDTNGGDNFLGGFTLQLTEDVALTYTTTFGKIGFGTSATGYSHSVVLNVAVTEKLNYVLLSDYVDYNGALIEAPFVDAFVNRYSVANYLFYEINDCWSAGARFEWFNTKLDIGDRADLYEVTVGLNYKPHPNLIFRPEVRWDQDNDGFIVPARDNDQLGFGMDMILTF
ncbi:MAG: porin [Pirellulaceae bacterium]|nr:porin [Pirellulaceae bacterium]